jgi:hypothetical protein
VTNEVEMSDTLRKHLQWAWNYALAAEWREDYTIKDVARDIAGGIIRGEDADDVDLLEDFARNYIESVDTPSDWVDKAWGIRDGWEPEAKEDENQLMELLIPYIKRLSEEGEI